MAKKGQEVKLIILLGVILIIITLLVVFKIYKRIFA